MGMAQARPNQEDVCHCGVSLSEQHTAGSILSCHKSCMYILNLSNLNYRFMVHEQLNILHCMEYKKCFTAGFILSCHEPCMYVFYNIELDKNMDSCDAFTSSG